MFTVYVDEAGTSGPEPVSVVVGIGFASEFERLMAYEALNQWYETYVPEVLQEKKGFVFHATDIMGKRALRKHLSPEARYEMMRSMMAIPRMLKLPIHLGMVRRTTERSEGVLKRISDAQWQHALAFLHCIAKADSEARRQLGPDAKVAVVAENVEKMRGLLSAIIIAGKDEPIVFPYELLRPTVAERQSGVLTQNREISTRCIESVVYRGKSDDPLLQLADACAFAFRRRFADLEYGREFVEAMLGGDVVAEDYSDKTSGATYRLE
jgi:hypothetical protein